VGNSTGVGCVGYGETEISDVGGSVSIVEKPRFSVSVTVPALCSSFLHNMCHSMSFSTIQHIVAYYLAKLISDYKLFTDKYYSLIRLI